MFELVSNPIGYFGKMNSTLGSVVPLAMFSYYQATYSTEIDKFQQLLEKYTDQLHPTHFLVTNDD